MGSNGPRSGGRRGAPSGHAQCDQDAPGRQQLSAPTLTKLDAALADESDGEHNQAKGLLARIESLPVSLERRRLMADLKEVVMADAALQEASVFPLLIERLDVGELEYLGRRMLAREQVLLHDGADTTGAAETAGHMIYPQI